MQGCNANRNTRAGDNREAVRSGTMATHQVGETLCYVQVAICSAFFLVHPSENWVIVRLPICRLNADFRLLHTKNVPHLHTFFESAAV